jgi:hypothetical protein
MHWGERYRIRNEWFAVVAAVCGRKDPPCDSKAHVTFIRVAKRTIDPTNCVSALKPVLDALVHQGFLRGDTFEDVVVTTDQRKCGKGEEPCVEVMIGHD